MSSFWDDYFDFARHYPEDHPPRIGGCSNGLVGSGRSVLTSYVVPPETWLAYTSAERRDNWVTPRIPPTVSLKCWNEFDPPRVAYVQEPNWEKKGARGPFALTHWGNGNFGLKFCIGQPISPALYHYLNETMGQSGASFAVLARNVWWMSAAIGGFDDVRSDPMGGQFWVHYNDNGHTYNHVRLPYADFTEYMRKILPDELRDKSWPTPPDQQEPAVTHGDSRPLTTPSPGLVVNLSGFEPSSSAAEVLAHPNTKPAEPTPNESFFGVDMKRFWPQFMVALEIALLSPVSSHDTLVALREKKHWPAIEAYMRKNRGKYRWMPPIYSVGTTLGHDKRPEYLST